ncbi:hypothetical protein AB0G02_39240, partial [Actinosynnema sp. NPDC023658]|uniref:hypothetical protein n=1 Tax=Actinosynnema sp. NPDC023658 TaxID=3155465 RepID=UPI0033C9CEB5
MPPYPFPRADAPSAAWSRADWAEAADVLLRAVRPHSSPRHARIALPGAAVGYGADVDALEG